MEFAIVGPIFIVLLLGIASYGGYFWLSHSIQQVANDAARAALSGLTASERQTLAQAQLTANLAGQAHLQAAKAKLNLAETGDSLSVSIDYDASASPFWALGGLVPMPSSTIVRGAVVRLGGY